METKSWEEIKDTVYGEKGTESRDELEREVESMTIGMMIREARERSKLTQSELGERINKKRTFISRIENDGSNITLKTLRTIVEKGLNGRVTISIDFD